MRIVLVLAARQIEIVEGFPDLNFASRLELKRYDQLCLREHNNRCARLVHVHLEAHRSSLRLLRELYFRDMLFDHLEMRVVVSNYLGVRLYDVSNPRHGSAPVYPLEEPVFGFRVSFLLTRSGLTFRGGGR